MVKLFALSIDNLNGNPIRLDDGVIGKIPTGGLSTSTGQNIIRTGFTLAIIIGVTLALFVLILSGVQWVTSGGDKQKLQASRQRIIYAIIGLLVIFLAWFVLSILGNVFGLNFLNPQVNNCVPPNC